MVKKRSSWRFKCDFSLLSGLEIVCTLLLLEEQRDDDTHALVYVRGLLTDIGAAGPRFVPTSSAQGLRTVFSVARLDFSRRSLEVEYKPVDS